MNANWIKVKGIIKQGHQVASGMAEASPYPRGSIEMQVPFFEELGLDLRPFFLATLNISISPYQFTLKNPGYTFRNVRWNPEIPAEDFSFSRCQLIFRGTTYQGWVYYPHPETKPQHFQDSSTLEVIFPYIADIGYGDFVELKLNNLEIILEIS